jgi:hypothetical protein
MTLIPTDGNPIDEGITLPVTTEETSTCITLNLTPGREYNASLIARNIDCSISSDAIQTVFTAIQNPPIPGKHATLKPWEWPGDEARLKYVYNTNGGPQQLALNHSYTQFNLYPN